MSRRRPVARAGALAFAAVFTAALVAFVTARPTVEARFPRREPHPPARHDLAAMEYGPTVVASSCDPSGQNHPAFLVDRRPRPTLLEKWASAPADRQPWVEIGWGDPHDLEEVVVVQGAAAGDERHVTRSFLLTCVTGRPGGEARPVSGAGRVSRVPLACRGATGLRVAFLLDDPSDTARIYEIEAWGR